MAKRALICLLLALGVTASAFADDPSHHKAQIDSNISSLKQRLSTHQQQEAALRDQIDNVSGQIQSLESRVGDVSLQVSTLDHDLALHRDRLGRLQNLLSLQAQTARRLKQEYQLAVNRLNRRVVSIYETPTPTTLDVMLGSSSIDDAITQTVYMNQIGLQDVRVAAEVGHARAAEQHARAQTKTVKQRIFGETRVISARAAQARAAQAQLVSARNSLAQTKATKLVALDQLTSSEQQEANEIDAEQSASDAIGAQIRAAQAAAAAAAASNSSSSSSSSPSSPPPAHAGSVSLIWPVNGPITSPFGWRWGRMHEGIDIGVPIGTPIHAAAAGTVIYCGWEEGYGNFTVIDHGGGVATAYGHQSAIQVTCGQHVSQGQVIGLTGCTGHCTGPHLHFEVRINGNPVDPLGYL